MIAMRFAISCQVYKPGNVTDSSLNTIPQSHYKQIQKAAFDEIVKALSAGIVAGDFDISIEGKGDDTVVGLYCCVWKLAKTVDPNG